jgi:hypothetical protein
MSGPPQNPRIREDGLIQRRTGTGIDTGDDQIRLSLYADLDEYVGAASRYRYLIGRRKNEFTGQARNRPRVGVAWAVGVCPNG